MAKPAIKHIPKIIEFLGYVPYDPPAWTIGEKIVTYRRLRGLSQKELARCLSIDPSTLGKWEKNKRQPPERILKELTTFMEKNPEMKNLKNEPELETAFIAQQ